MLSNLFSHLWELWAVVSVACLILELGSGDLFLLSFAISAAVTAICSLIFPSIYVHLLVFAIASLMTLLLVRPSLLKLLHKGEDKRESNTDALVGKQGVVSETIVAGGYGRVMLGGDDWKACSADGSEIQKGTTVRMVKQESIILTVEKI